MRRDLAAMLWKEYRQFRKNAANEIGTIVVIAFLVAFLMPFGIVRSAVGRAVEPFSGVLAALVIFAAFLYMSLVSEGSFSDEIQEGTMRMLLATGIRPPAVFVAKWLALMARAAALVITAAFFEFAALALQSAGPVTLDLKWLAWGMGFAMLVSSYTAAANAAVSLVTRTAMQFRQYGTVVSLIPLVALGGLAHLVGIGRGAISILSLLLFALTVASFFIAVAAFRSEKTRA